MRMQTLMKTNSKDSKLTWSVIVKRKTAFDAMPYCVEDLYYPANDTEGSKLNWSPFEVLTVLKVSCCVKVNPFSASSVVLSRWKLISVKVDGISLRIFATLFSARDHSADPYLSFTAKMYVPELGVADEWCFECEQSTFTHSRKAIYSVSGCPA